MDTLTAVITTYGPYAFGLVALVCLWQLVVRPELEANREHARQIAEGTNRRLEEVRDNVRIVIEQLDDVHDAVRGDKLRATCGQPNVPTSGGRNAA